MPNGRKKDWSKTRVSAVAPSREHVTAISLQPHNNTETGSHPKHSHMRSVISLVRTVLHFHGVQEKKAFFCSLLLERDLLAKKVPGGTPFEIGRNELKQGCKKNGDEKCQGVSVGYETSVSMFGLM